MELPESFGATEREASQSSSESPKGAADTAPEKPVAESKETERKEPQGQDLDSLERVRFRGKEYSKEELESLLLGKSQQPESDTKKFDENFGFDLAAVLKDPSKLAQFEQIYPAQYVERAKAILAQYGASAKVDATSKEQATPAKDPRFDEVWETVQEWKQHQKETRIQSYQQQLDTTFEKLGTKYEQADPEVINSRLLALAQQGVQLQDEKGKLKSSLVEKLFKQDHEKRTAHYESLYRKKVDAQKTATAGAQDMGRGGSPASGAPKKIGTIREATKQLLSDIEAAK